MTATTMNAPRVKFTTSGQIAVSALMLILGSRLALFAMFQMLIAGGLAAAGLATGFEFVTAYAASKFGLEGWMESLQAESPRLASRRPSQIPGFFRTELLTEQLTNFVEPSIADYDECRGPLVDYWKAQNGQQSGDPAKLARALITIASEKQPPRRFIAGADAIATAEQKVADLKAQIDANRRLSTSLAFN